MFQLLNFSYHHIFQNANRNKSELYGLTVVDPTTILVTHLLEIIKSKAHELIGRQEVKLIIDAAKERYSAVVDELIPDLMTLGEVQKVLQNLLREKIKVIKSV